MAEVESLPDAAATRALARRVALAARPGDAVLLSGELGVGKTEFARGFVAALAPDAGEVVSPTFTLVQGYDAKPAPIWHFDLYRIERPAELDELGLDEALARGMAVIEWPARLGARLPPDRLEITLEFGPTPDSRRASLTGFGSWRERLARLRAMDGFLAEAGWGKAARAKLAGDASFRKYLRLNRDGESAVLMDAPPPQENVRPFLAIARHLTGLGYSAPRILAADEARGFLLLEDLGDDLFSRAIPAGADQAQLYGAAVDLLVDLHRHALPAGIPAWDLAPMLAGAELLLDWYMPEFGAPASEAARAEFRRLWTEALERALAGRQVLVLRDYHADNLLWLPKRHGHARVGLLDFQDAARGSPAYDLASLLDDARRVVPRTLAAELRARYVAAAGIDAAAFDAAYHIVSAQRLTRIAGLWIRLLRRDGKPGYLGFTARTWELLEATLIHPALVDIRAWFDRNLPASLRARVPKGMSDAA
ncbi:MAG: tRNA (adenosine(37)-N6)-threonylcarbamoyltransferase complex ATPase subunit type 1 TsaE [Alphaproteobacteria bacterium]|nr:tRNA (adenosine(37)-N6)-threonylcarbamoyltransferase complex ATPase subunit type 1 TsaE [Alphaproteobacteria bacterium]